MKVSCLQENLAQGLSTVGRATARRSAMLPVLNHVLLATDNGRLKLSATNLETGINCWIGAKSEDAGGVAVPARTLTDLVKALPPGRIDLELDERTQTLNLKSDRTEANIKGIEALEFPVIPTAQEDGDIQIEPATLAKLIKQVAFAASPDAGRIMLTGVYAELDGDQIKMTAADGFRLSSRTDTLVEPVDEPLNVLIPASALTELGRIAGDEKEPIRLTVNKKRGQVLFSLTNTDLVAQLIEMNFPDYNQIIPDDHAIRVIVETDEFRRICRTASIFARDSADAVRLRVLPADGETPGRLKVFARSDETGKHEDVIDAEVEQDEHHDEFKITVSVRYLLDALAVIDTDKLALEMTTPASPIALKPVGDDAFVHVIMPMHDAYS